VKNPYIRKTWECVGIAILPCLMSLSSFAITRAEWEADNSLIPTPSSSSAFYVTGQRPTQSEQMVSADMTGLDATATNRAYEFPFLTWFTTFPNGLKLIFR